MDIPVILREQSTEESSILRPQGISAQNDI